MPCGGLLEALFLFLPFVDFAPVPSFSPLWFFSPQGKIAFLSTWCTAHT